jgi:hypothetical protein
LVWAWPAQGQTVGVFDEAKKLWRMTLAGDDAARIAAQR